MGASDFQLSDKPQVLFDEQGRIIAVNQAAAEALNLEPLDLLGASADALPEDWKSKVGQIEPTVSVLPRLWEAIFHAATLAEAVPHLRAVARIQGGGRMFGLWLKTRDGIHLVYGLPDTLPKVITPAMSLAIRLGREEQFDGAFFYPVEGWPAGLASRAWPLFIGGELAALVATGPSTDDDSRWVMQLRSALARFYYPAA